MRILAVLCLVFLFGEFAKAETVSISQSSRITHLKKLYTQTAIALEGKPSRNIIDHFFKLEGVTSDDDVRNHIFKIMKI